MKKGFALSTAQTLFYYLCAYKYSREHTMKINEIVQPAKPPAVATDSAQSLSRIQSVIQQSAQSEKRKKPTKAELVMGLMAYARLKRDAEQQQKDQLMRQLRNLEIAKQLPPKL